MQNPPLCSSISVIFERRQSLVTKRPIGCSNHPTPIPPPPPPRGGKGEGIPEARVRNFKVCKDNNKKKLQIIYKCLKWIKNINKK